MHLLKASRGSKYAPVISSADNESDDISLDEKSDERLGVRRPFLQRHRNLIIIHIILLIVYSVPVLMLWNRVLSEKIHGPQLIDCELSCA